MTVYQRDNWKGSRGTAVRTKIFNERAIAKNAVWHQGEPCYAFNDYYPLPMVKNGLVDKIKVESSKGQRCGAPFA